MLKFYTLLFTSWVVFSCSTGPEEGTKNPKLSNNRVDAPSFTLQSVTSSNVSNGPISLSDYAGKVVYLFFLGYNCPNCKASAPDTKTIFNKYKDENFVLLGLDEWNGSAGGVANFITGTGVEYPVLTKASSVARSYGVSYDYSVLVDKQGKIAYKGNGVQKNQLIANIDTLI